MRERPESGGAGCCLRPTPTLRPPLSSVLLLGLGRKGETLTRSIHLAVGGDGRRKVIAVETGVASGFIIIAAAAITGTPWLLVIGLAGHGLKDLWQHRTHFVANTRWWPPFCLVVDFVVAAVIAFEIVAGLDFH